MRIESITYDDKSKLLTVNIEEFVSDKELIDTLDKVLEESKAKYNDMKNVIINILHAESAYKTPKPSLN